MSRPSVRKPSAPLPDFNQGNPGRHPSTPHSSVSLHKPAVSPLIISVTLLWALSGSIKTMKLLPACVTPRSKAFSDSPLPMASSPDPRGPPWVQLLPPVPACSPRQTLLHSSPCYGALSTSDAHFVPLLSYTFLVVSSHWIISCLRARAVSCSSMNP